MPGPRRAQTPFLRCPDELEDRGVTVPGRSCWRSVRRRGSTRKLPNQQSRCEFSTSLAGGDLLSWGSRSLWQRPEKSGVETVARGRAIPVVGVGIVLVRGKCRSPAERLLSGNLGPEQPQMEEERTMNTMKKVVITLAALLVAAPALAASGAGRPPPPGGAPGGGGGRTPDGEPASGAGREQR